MRLRRRLLVCAFGCACATAIPGAASAGVGFALAPGTPVAVDSGPNGIATGDFNGDGSLDVAAVGDNVGTVVILLGDGHGGFTPTQTIAVGSGPESVAAGDFDENGTVDLAVANALSDGVEILSGDGAGRFTPAGAVAGVTGAWWITAADLNGDGHLDMAVSHAYADASHTTLGSGVSILLGDGHGAFSQTAVLPTGSVPYGIAAADLNGDGHPDLAVADQYSQNVLVFLGDGTGSFTQSATIGVPAGPSWVVARDLDGDGRPDLAVSSQGASTISILHGDGSGGFTTQSTLPAGSGTTPLLALDVDGDGNVDLVSGNISSNDVTVLRGDGHGGFGAATSFPAGTKPFALAAGDANRDGRLDLVVGDYAPSEVRTLLNTSTPPAPAPTALTGERLSSGFGPCTWTGGGPPPIGTCTATAPVVGATCDPNGTSTLTIDRSGYASGPVNGTYTETLTATIGPQTGPAAPAFQPFADTGFQAGSDGFPTGLIESLTSHFTITSYDGATTVTGDAQLVPDLANTGVCREFDNEVTGSTVHGGALLTGYFYFLNAQRLGFDASIATGGATTAVSSELESYLQNSFATYTDSTTGGLDVASATGVLLDGLGTTHPAYGTTTSAPTPAGTSVATSPAPGVQLTFDQVTASGATSVTALTTAPPLPTGFSVGDPPLYYEISTTAAFGGQIKICAPYGAAPAGEQPRLLHYTNGAWQDVTVGVDDLNRVVCGLVSSLSPFAAAFTAADTTPPTLTVPTGIVFDATSPAGAVVTWTASAVDSGHAVPVSCLPASGSTFAIGDTTVDCEATDATGNTAKASFGVHVRGAAEQLARLQATVAAGELGPARSGIAQQVALAARSLDRPHTACQALGTAATLLRTPAAHGAGVAGALVDVTRIRAVLGCG